MQPGDGAIELFLCRGSAGDGEVHTSEFRRFVTVITMLRSNRLREKQEEND